MRNKILLIYTYKPLVLITFMLFVFLISHFSSLILPKAEAAAQTLRVSPVIINVGLSPDKTYNHEITIENLTNTPIPLKASFNDFITSGEEGGYVFENTRTNPLLTWTKLNEMDIILSPKEKRTLQLTIKTPQSIPLGGYYGILFFEPVTQNAAQNATRVSSKIGILMLANVGVADPKAQKAEIVSFSTSLLDQDGNLPLLLRVKNISLNFFTAKPILKLTPLIKNVIPDLIGDPVNKEFFVPLDSRLRGNDNAEPKRILLEDKIIFPGQIRRWTEESTMQNLSPNIYRAQMAVSTGDGQYVSKETHFVVFPFAKVLGITGLLALILLMLIKRTRLKKAILALIR